MLSVGRRGNFVRWNGGIRFPGSGPFFGARAPHRRHYYEVVDRRISRIRLQRRDAGGENRIEGMAWFRPAAVAGKNGGNQRALDALTIHARLSP